MRFLTLFATLPLSCTGCGDSVKVVDCLEAVNLRAERGYCSTSGTIYQEGADYRISPPGHGKYAPKLIILADPTEYADPEEYRRVGEFSYCGPYSNELGGLIIIYIPFNEPRAYRGDITLNDCPNAG